MTDIGTAPARGALDSDALSELREGFRGDVIEPGDARYDETRRCSTACSTAARRRSCGRPAPPT